MTVLRALAATALVALSLWACAPSDDGPVVVLTASSLVDVTADLADAWGESEVLISDAGSQVLDAQLRGGADADAILLADAWIATGLANDGIAEPPQVVAYNDLAIAVAPHATDRITALTDLAAPGIRLVLADEGVPLGDRTREALDLAVEVGLLPDQDALLDNVVSYEDAARVVLAKVASREVDAAVVYATDALAAGRRVGTVDWPEAAAVDIRYSVQTVVDARGPASSFTRFVASPDAAPIWKRHGFRPVSR